MPLHELQTAFAMAVVTGNAGAIAPELAGECSQALRRLQIYRNHYLITLREALAANFPTVVRLLGERHFDRLVRLFAQRHPPRTPNLFEYGEDFPLFLQRHPISVRMPLLSDLARLEWAMNLAHNAPSVPPLEGAALRTVPPAQWHHIRFLLHPATQLVSSRYPLDRIWRADLRPERLEGAEIMRSPGVRLLILRDRDGDVASRNLTAGESTFFRTLRSGLPLGRAVRAGSARESGLAPGDFLLSLVEVGAFTGFQL